MKNYICTGERLVVTAPVGGLTSGQAYVVGSKVCIVLSGGLEGELVTVLTEGVFELAKAAGAVTVGQKMYWDDTNKVLTTVAGAGNIYVGYAFKANAAGDATGTVVLVDNPGVTKSTLIAQEATVNGSDLATTQALANALKAKVNALLTAMIAAGLMSNS